VAAVALPPPTIVVVDAQSSALAAGLKRFGIALGRAFVAVGLVVVLWQLFVVSLGENLAFSTRGPVDVWRYLFGTNSGPARHAIQSLLWVTLGDAAIGLVSGTVGAILVALAFNLYRPLEQGLMPVAMALRSVPLVAMAPLIALIFGRGLVTVGVVGAIVTFFPTLVNMSFGLRSAPQQSVDLFKAYGGGRIYTLLKLQFPFALPSLFAAMRATAPLAITGALLAEFFLVGTGLGHAINDARNTFEYDAMWAEAAVITLFSVLTYAITVGVESAVLAKFAPDRARAAKTGA